MSIAIMVYMAGTLVLLLAGLLSIWAYLFRDHEIGVWTRYLEEKWPST